MKRIMSVLVALFTIIGSYSNAQGGVNNSTSSAQPGANLDCPLHIERLRVYSDNQTSTLPIFDNQSGNSPTNQEDFTSSCIPHSTSPLLRINASSGNVYIAVYVDNNNDGIYEWPLVSGSFAVSTGSVAVTFPPGFLNFEAKLRIITSDQPITNPTAIPTCGEVEDYVFCPEKNCSCDPSLLALGPITLIQSAQDCASYSIDVPAVDGCLAVEATRNYNFIIINPNGATALNVDSNLDATQFDFSSHPFGEYTIIVTYTMTDDSGCDHVLPPVSTTFNWTGCSNCLCDISNVSVGPFTFAESQDNCELYGISIDPITACPNVGGSHHYLWQIYRSNGVLSHESTVNSNWTQNVFAAADVYTVVLTYTLTDVNGCSQTIVYEEDFDFAGCDDCACDISNTALGPFTFAQSQSNCELFGISAPPVSPCPNVEVSHNYLWQIYRSNGVLSHQSTQNSNWTQNVFAAPDVYTIVLTYTITDNTGCTQTIIYEEEFDWAGCNDCQLLGPPTTLNCQPGASFHTLSWLPVAGADSYELEMVFNDPNCCSGLMEAPSRWIFRPTGTTLNFANKYCYSWRVRSVCSNGSKSAWSTRQCSCGSTTGTSIGSKSLIQSGDGSESVQLDLSAVPNPATNHVDVTLSGLPIDMTLVQPEMIIHDISGKVVYTSEITLDESKRVDLSSFNSGMYLINVIDNGTVLSTERLIVE